MAPDPMAGAVRRARVKASTVVVSCECGAEVFRTLLSCAQAAQNATNALIRQAGAAHARTCPRGAEAELFVRCDTDAGEISRTL